MFITKERKTKMRKLLIIGAALVAAPASQGSAENLPQLDSTQFSHRYEMETRLTAEDVDGDGYADFRAVNFSDSDPSSGLCSIWFNANCYFASDTDSGVASAWQKFASTLQGDGYTLEIRTKVVSSSGTFAFALTASDGSNYDMCLLFKTNEVCWGHISTYSSVTNFDTTTRFHTYRIAKIPGESRSVLWCDGVLVKDDLGDAFNDSGINRLLLGSISGVMAGKGEISYLRFTKGAYAPPKLKKRDKMRDSADFDVKYEMDSVPASFVQKNTVTTSSDGGVTRFNFAERGYYEGNSDWSGFSALARSYGYTMELRAKFVGSTSGYGICLTASDNTDYDTFLLVKNGSLSWGPLVAITTITNLDTTADFHVYRIVKEPDNNRFSFYCDGNLVSDSLTDGMSGKDNRFLFGAIGGGYGGTIDVDYLRYTSGVWYPYIPPKGTVMMFR